MAKTIVKSIRISEELWERLGEIAKAEGRSRNSLIISKLEKIKKAKNIVDKGKNM